MSSEGKPPLPQKFFEPKTDVPKAGIQFGCALAIAISWAANKSLFWVCVHGALGWFYVIYYLLTSSDWSLF